MASPVSVSGGEVQTPVGSPPVIPLLMVGIGGYIAWFAIHYWADPAVIWPSDPVKTVLQGGGLPTHTTAAQAGTSPNATLTAYEAGIVPAAGAAAPAAAAPATSKAAANRAKLTAGRGTGAGKRVK
jgi:hypothetical protein